MESPKDDKEHSGFSIYGNALRSAGPILGSGIQLAATVVLMFFLGRWLDSKFGSDPWLMLVGTFFGLGAGLYNFVKIVQRADKKKTEV
jgi:F0F1-type ATP synthase assembly protein I